MVPGVWCMVYGVWCLVYGVWCTVYGIRCMVYGVWCMVHGIRYTRKDRMVRTLEACPRRSSTSVSVRHISVSGTRAKRSRHA